jgi:hypothetical protein
MIAGVSVGIGNRENGEIASWPGCERILVNYYMKESMKPQ